MTELREVELANGILSFDGRVIEAFGFYTDTDRVHVGQLQKLDCKQKGNRVVLAVHGSGGSNFVLTGKFDPDRAMDLEGWVEAIRAAAPSARVSG